LRLRRSRFKVRGTPKRRNVKRTAEHFGSSVVKNLS
jgi:hypothetical protein